MRHPTAIKKLLEAVMWKFLVKHVFSLDGLVWAGPPRDDLRNLSKNFLGMTYKNTHSYAKLTVFQPVFRMVQSQTKNIMLGELNVQTCSYVLTQANMQRDTEKTKVALSI
jgi:hypothetical protein